MPDEPTTLPVDAWLDRVRAVLGSQRDLGLTAAEERELLELARIAAHASERIAAPLSTFLAGIALADLASAERAERLKALKGLLDKADS